jgi:hypothetical protein
VKEDIQIQEESEEWRRFSYKTVHTNERKSKEESNTINGTAKFTICMERKIPFYYIK